MKKPVLLPIHTQITTMNRRWLDKMAKKHNTSLQDVINKVLTKVRTGEFEVKI